MKGNDGHTEIFTLHCPIWNLQMHLTYCKHERSGLLASQMNWILAVNKNHTTKAQSNYEPQTHVPTVAAACRLANCLGSKELRQLRNLTDTALPVNDFRDSVDEKRFTKE
jgi:hypothetical protein